jgi:hypothetical protein
VFNPNSWIQGHAIWHLLSSLGVFLFYFYFERERSISDFPRLHLSVCEAPDPGPPVDAPAPPQRAARELHHLPVKFKDADVGRHLRRPFSLRKYRSAALSLGPPQPQPDSAEFSPRGGGEHPAPTGPLR